MQTFLPYPSFERTAHILDPRRLGTQRVEALQILRAQHIPTYGWRHHPALRMWRGHEEALAADDSITMPRSLGEESFHRSHQSSLVRKDPDRYRRFFPDGLPYVWPEP